MASTADFRNGLTIEVEGEPYVIVYFQHVKPGKGPAFVRTKLKQVKTGSVLEKTFTAGHRVTLAHVVRKPVQFLYRQGDQAHLMDMATFDEFEVGPDIMGDAYQYVTEGSDVSLVLWAGQAIGLELPVAVLLKVTETPPGVKGDTASGGSKPATTETGLQVQVPLFVNEGDTIKVDTRTAEYLERAQ